ncbi:ABC transporter substrate-binding protein [Deinococcus sp.]|uniref:ABC transporter substrate-binding protein n=1 Tax=Deinococcus sp. TaxID=47478 RepID=UPI0025F32702|nr:ABC transporter substrate-binding protein [Deinococcus sp.]
MRFRIFAALMLSLLPSAQARSLDLIRSSGVLRIATTTDVEPISFIQNGQLAGFSYELGQLTAKSMNLKTQWVTRPFDELPRGLAQDQYDVVISTQVIDPNNNLADFTRPYFCTSAVLVARQSELLRPSKKMDGKTFVVQAGTSYQKYAQQLPFAKKVTVVGNAQSALQSVALGKADATITDKYVALQMMLVYGKSPMSASGPYRDERIGMTVSKGNDGLRTALNAALGRVMGNGSYHLASMLAFREDARCEL